MTQQVDVVNDFPLSKDDEVMEALHAVMHAFRSRQHRQLRDSVQEVGPMEIRALRFFARHPGATQRELVAHSGRDKGQIARLLASLRERGLLEARADEQDRRCTRLQLSPAGATLLDQARRSTAPLVAAATDGFSPPNGSSCWRCCSACAPGWKRCRREMRGVSVTLHRNE